MKKLLLLLFIFGVSLTYAQTYSGGAGTTADPYEISNKADLKYLSENSSEWAKHFLQTADITFLTADFATGGDFYNAGGGFNSIGNNLTAFTGTYNGNAHTIDNIYINKPTTSPLGFFGTVGGYSSSITNLGVINSTITGKEGVGIMVGLTVDSVVISNCYTSGDVTGYEKVGGFIGYQYSVGGGTINNCYSTASVTATYYRAGGFVGFAKGPNCKIENCFAVGLVQSPGGSTNGFIGEINSIPIINNCFWDTQSSGQPSANTTGTTGKTTTQMQTESTFTGATWDFVVETTNGTDDIWQMDLSNINNGYPIFDWQIPAAVPPCSTTFSGGAGTALSPYQIANKADLKILSENDCFWDKHFIQTADIAFTTADFASGGDFYNAGEGFIPIGVNYYNQFDGSYLGGGHTIDGLYINRPTLDNVGLFAYMTGVLNNLGVTNVNITGHDIVGGLVGIVTLNGSVNNCFSTGSVNGNSIVGGLVGYQYSGGVYGTRNSYSHANVIAVTVKAGGFAGYVKNPGLISNCYSTGQVTGTTSIGGFLGEVSGVVTVNGSFWDTQTSGHSSSLRGVGKTTAEMKTDTTFTGAAWDFVTETTNGTDDIWQIEQICLGYNYPTLSWQAAQTGVVQDDASFSYSAAAYCTGAVNPIPTVSGLAGGTFTSAPAGLSISASTGEVNLTASTAGTYFITYTTNGSCPNSANDTISVGGVCENALNFDETDDYVSGTNTNLPQGNAPRSIEAWVKISSVSGFEVIYNYGNAGATNQRSSLMLNNSGRIHYAGENNDFTGTTTIADNLWHHIAYTHDGTTAKIYVDGNLDGSTSNPNYGTNGYDFNIGRRVNFNSEYFNGNIEEVSVWNVARTAAEIQASMTCKLSGYETGLVAYYDFNEGIADATNTGITTLPDLTGNGDGTLHNFALTGTSSNWVSGVTKGASCYSVWTGTTSTDWSVASNWLAGTVPTSSESIIIPTTPTGGNFPTTTANNSVGDLAIAPGASLTIGAGLGLIINEDGIVTNNGTVTLEASATGTAWLDDFTNTGTSFTGNITAQQYITAGSGLGQRMFGSPINNGVVQGLNTTYEGAGGLGQTTMSDCATMQVDAGSNYSNLFEWHENASSANDCEYEAWYAINDAASLTNGRGYSGWMNDASVISFTGAPNTGNVNYTGLTSTTSTAQNLIDNKDGWHVLSNPYPSAMVPNSLTSNGWASLQTYNGASGAYGGTFQPITPAQEISVAQGFVGHTATSANTAAFTNAMRTQGSTQFKSTNSWFTSKLDIEVTNQAGLKDVSYVYFNNEASASFDNQWDCEKRESDAGVPTLYTKIGNEKISLNGNNTAELGNYSIPLGLQPAADTEFTFTVNGLSSLPSTTIVYLEDKATSVWTNLMETNTYTFNMTQQENEDRFELHFTKPMELEKTSETCIGNDGEIVLDFGSQSINGDLVNWNYTLSNGTENMANGSTSSVVAWNNLTPGTYELILTNGAYTTTQNITIEDVMQVAAAVELNTKSINVGESILVTNLSTSATTYTWTVNNETFTSQDLTYTFENAGVYEIVLVAANETCTSEENILVEVSQKTISGINENFLLENVKVYTNGTTIVVDMSNVDLDGKTDIIIYDIVGQLIAQKLNAETIENIEMENKSKGFYFVRILNNGKSLSKKVVVE